MITDLYNREGKAGDPGLTSYEFGAGAGRRVRKVGKRMNDKVEERRVDVKDKIIENEF